jgi:hypothetical protein
VRQTAEALTARPLSLAESLDRFYAEYKESP